MLKITLFSSLLAFSLLFQGCSSEKKESTQTTAKANALLATNEIVLTTLTDKQIVLHKTNDGLSLEDKKKPIVIFDIFATWCPPCQAEASVLSSIQKKYNKYVEVIGVTIEDNIPNEKLKTFQKDYNANYTIVNSAQNRTLIDDLATKLKLGNNFGIPLVVIYKDGKLVNYYQGVTEEEFIESDLKKALEI